MLYQEKSGNPAFGCEASFCVETRQEKGPKQGCQIFLDTINESGKKYSKLSQHYLPNGPKIYQMAVKYSK
jgi:hypothetical protein